MHRLVLAAQVSGTTGSALAAVPGGLWIVAQLGQFLFQHFDALDQAGNGLGYRVGEQVVVEVDAIGLVVAAVTRIDDVARYSDHGALGRHVLDVHRIGADAHTLANADRAENLGPGASPCSRRCRRA